MADEYLTLDGQEVETGNPTTQVYKATHDGAGNRLPYMQRSFISFSYDGRNIEDFNLIATIDGNMMQRQVYASFTDNVTQSDVFDGQIYWDSHYDANSLELTLSTDHMLEEELNDFSNWFVPGKIAPLILAEHPNRAILARIAEAPQYNMIPFEEKTNQTILSQVYDYSTTVYRGSISLKFVMDDPFWYSVKNLLNTKNSQGEWSNEWIDANGQSVNIFNSPDALKIIAEDHTPISSMLTSRGPDHPTDPENYIQMMFGTDIIGAGEEYLTPEEREQLDPTDISITAIDHFDNVSTIEEGKGAYFFYGGTAAGKPILTFSIQISLDSTSKYIISPRNSITNVSNAYNTIIFRGQHEIPFKFSLPGLYMGYNQAIKIFTEMSSSDSWEDVRQRLRDNIKHRLPRAFAINVLDAIKTGEHPNSTLSVQAITMMEKFIVGNDSANPPLATFSFNSKTGEAIGQMPYYNFNSYSTNQIAEENVGDMVRSKYPIIVDRDGYNSLGQVRRWVTSYRYFSHVMYANIDLYHINLEYQYLYS